MSCLVTESCSHADGSSTSRVVMYNAIHGASVCPGDIYSCHMCCAYHMQVYHCLGMPAHLELHERLFLQCLKKRVIVCAVDSVWAMVFNIGRISLPSC